MTPPVTRGTYHRQCQTCSWTSSYATPRMADYGLRRHSCEKQQRRDAARARGEQRMAAVDRTPKPCQHKQADHQHGTYACYTLDACRCLPCAYAQTTYETDRKRQHAYGRWNGLVDAEPARRHVLALMAQGMGMKRVAAMAGYSNSALGKLLYGHDGRPPSERITPGTEARVLAVTLDLADGARVPIYLAMRRIQALVALGWSQAKIARRVGILQHNFGPYTHGQRPQLTVAHDKAIRALYDELSMTLPPEDNHRDRIAASRGRNYARARGWLPPLALDDDPTQGAPAADDVPPGLDAVAIWRRMQGDKTVRLTKAEKAEVVRLWKESGRPLSEMERHTGVNAHRYPLGGAA